MIAQGDPFSQGSSFSTGVEVQDKRKRVMSISTGSKSVDVILGGKSFFTSPPISLNVPVQGGIMSQSISEGIDSYGLRFSAASKFSNLSSLRRISYREDATCSHDECCGSITSGAWRSVWKGADGIH